MAEFIRKYEMKQTMRSTDTKSEVLDAVKEAMVDVMKNKKLGMDSVAMAEAARAVKDAFAKYVRGASTDDEMRELRDLAVIKSIEVLGAKNTMIVSEFQKALNDHLPPFPEPRNQPLSDDWKDWPPDAEPRHSTK